MASRDPHPPKSIDRPTLARRLGLVALLLLTTVVSSVAGALPARSQTTQEPDGWIVWATCRSDRVFNQDITESNRYRPISGKSPDSAVRGPYYRYNAAGTRIASATLNPNVREFQTYPSDEGTGPSRTFTLPVGYQRLSAGIAWSPDGTKVAIEAIAPDLRLVLFVVDDSGPGGLVTELPVDAGDTDLVPYSQISWGPSGILSYASNGSTTLADRYKLVTFPSTGGSATVLENLPERPNGDRLSSPRWLASGAYAYAIGRQVVVGGTAVTPVSPTGSQFEGFAVSPDGSWVATSWMYRDPTTGLSRTTLFASRLDGSDLKQLDRSEDETQRGCGLDWYVARDSNRPSSSFTAENLPGFPKNMFRFTSTTQPINGFTPSLVWNFGDGQTQQGGDFVNHTYVRAGKYTATLTASVGGDSDIATREITVEAADLDSSLRILDLPDGLGSLKPDQTATVELTAYATDAGLGGIKDLSLPTPLSFSRPDAFEIISGPSPRIDGSIPAGGQRSFQWEVKAKKTGRVTLMTTIRGSNQGDEPRTSTATLNTNIDASALDVAMEFDPKTVSVADSETGTGKTFIVNVKLTNTSTTPLHDITFQGPPSFALADVDPSAGIIVPPRVEPSTDPAPVGDLAPGASTTVSFTARARYNGSFNASTLLTYVVDGSVAPSFARGNATLNPDGSLAILDVTTDPKKPAVKEPFLLHVKLKNTGKTAITSVRPTAEFLPSTIITVAPDSEGKATPGKIRLEPGAEFDFTLPFVGGATGDVQVQTTAAGTIVGGGGQISSLLNVSRIRIGNPALDVSFTGKATGKNEMLLTATIKNIADEDLRDITWTTKGLVLESVDPKIPIPITQTSGPTPALPTNLADKASVDVTWNFHVDDVGQVVALLAGQGTRNGGGIAKGNGAATVTATGPKYDADEIKRRIARGMSEMLDAAHEQYELERQAIDEVAAQAPPAKPPVSGAAGFERVMKQSDAELAQMLGYPPGTKLVSGATPVQMIEGRLAETEAFINAGKESIGGLWKIASAAGSGTYLVATDPKARAATAAWLTDVGVAAKENGGYAMDAMKNSLTPEGLDTWLDANTQVASDSYNFVVPELARQAKAEIQASYQLSKTDPLAYQRKIGAVKGKLQWLVAETVLTDGLGSAAKKGGTTALTKAADSIPFLANRKREAAELRAAAEALPEGARTLEEFVELSKNSVNDLQQLDVGTALTADTAAKFGGLPQTELGNIQGILKKMREKFGIDFVFGIRTLERESLSITDGWAKRQILTEKAVSAIDRILGASPDAVGVMSVYKPTLPSEKVLQYLEGEAPGIRTRILDRFRTQEANWATYQKGEGGVAFFEKASTKHPGGINAFLERPGIGNEVPYGLKYYEQLDETGFIDTLMKDQQFLRDKAQLLDGTDATLRRVASETRNELKQTLKTREMTKVKINAQKFGDTVSFRNGNQWVVSDLDGQYFMPADGVWPAGLRAQMETEFNALAKQYVERWPDHGWSNTANDLQGWLGDKLFDFQLPLVAPRDLPDAIRRTLERLPEVARQKRLKAAALGNTPFAKKLLAQADELDATTYDTLFKKFKDKTEKIIVITTGDVRVGFNPAIKAVGP